MALSLDIILDNQELLSSIEIWRALGIESELGKLAPMRVSDLFLDKTVKNIARYLESAEDKMNFYLVFGGGSPLKRPAIRFIPMRDEGYARIGVADLDKLIENRAGWLKGIFSHERFICARLYNSRYQSIQNTESIQSYEIKGLDHSQMPKKHNGLAYPLGEEIIDISDNPGRFEPRHSYEAAVGAEMWLGKRFFECTNLSVEQLDRSDFQVTEQDGIYHLQAYSKPFDSAEGEQGRIQRQLWRLLYGNTEQ